MAPSLAESRRVCRFDGRGRDGLSCRPPTLDIHHILKGKYDVYEVNDVKGHGADDYDDDHDDDECRTVCKVDDSGPAALSCKPPTLNFHEMILN